MPRRKWGQRAAAQLASSFKKAVRNRECETMLPISAFNIKMLRHLQKEGYVLTFWIELDGYIFVKLMFDDYGESILWTLQRQSKPSRPLSVTHSRLCKMSRDNRARILLTPKGLMSNYEAIKRRSGGTLLFKIE